MVPVPVADDLDALNEKLLKDCISCHPTVIHYLNFIAYILPEQQSRIRLIVLHISVWYHTPLDTLDTDQKLPVLTRTMVRWHAHSIRHPCFV